MPAGLKLNIKLNRTQSKMLAVVTSCSILTVFSLVGARVLWSQAAYHRHELAAKRTAVKQLKDNITIAQTLQTQYGSFNSTNPNVIGGKNVSDPNTVPPDGDNARIILDALPSKYDFPALISSVAKILKNNSINNQSIGGTDQSGSLNSEPAANPQVTPIALSVSGAATYQGVQMLVRDLERSIRPFDITKLQISGSSSNSSVSAEVTTYFQPAKILGSETQEVK